VFVSGEDVGVSFWVFGKVVEKFLVRIFVYGIKGIRVF
jgi:hypothetical protein